MHSNCFWFDGKWKFSPDLYKFIIIYSNETNGKFRRGYRKKSWLKCVVERKMNELYDRMNESEDDKIISFYNNFLLDEIYSSTSNTLRLFAVEISFIVRYCLIIVYLLSIFVSSKVKLSFALENSEFASLVNLPTILFPFIFFLFVITCWIQINGISILIELLCDGIDIKI